MPVANVARRAAVAATPPALSFVPAVIPRFPAGG